MKVFFAEMKSGAWTKRCLILPLLFVAQVMYGQPANSALEFPGGRMTFGQAFDIIEEQGGVLLGYATNEVDVLQVVDLAPGTYSVGGILDLMFDGTDYTYSVSGKHILITVEEKIVPEPQPEPAAPVEVIRVPSDVYKVRLPELAVKTNLLYDITTTINLGMEVGLGCRLSLDVPFNYNAWKFKGDTRLRHWGLQPELRYWFCQRFGGWFAGVHAHYAQFNVGGLPDWSVISENMQKNRYQGHLWGGGVSVGYSWILKNQWSMEATVGVGYARLEYDKYPCAECGTSLGCKNRDYFGITKVGLSLVYIIK